MSRRFLALCCGLVLCLAGAARGQELIPNGGFETYRNCPQQDNLLDEALPWYNPNRATPDFYNQCFPTNQIELPPHGGRGLGRLFLDQGWAEYMATPLKQPLIADKCYYFELYISTRTPTPYLPGTIGAHFSAEPLTTNTKELLRVSPQVLDRPDKTVTRPAKWERIAGTFKAAGGERFVTIGSFNRLPAFLGFYYIFLDDISLRPIDLDLGHDTTLCGRQSTLLLRAGTPGATKYSWQDGSTDSSYRVTRPGLYHVTVTTPCTVMRDTIRVDYALPFTLGADTTLCLGQTMTLRGPTGADTYTWQDGSTAASYTVSQIGTYSLRVRQADCVAADTVRVNLVAAPQLVLGPDKALCGAETYTIRPEFANGTFVWQDGFDQTDRTVGQSGSYRASVGNACATARDSIQINYSDCGCVIYAPDVFTPNADGHNDEFHPFACGDITFLSMAVVNRWGEVVFRTDAGPFAWNGFSDQTACPAGVYAWQIVYELRQGERVSRQQKEGRLLLTR